MKKHLLLFLTFCLYTSQQLMCQCPSDHAQLRDWYNNNNGASWNVNWNTPPQSINDVNMTNWDGITKNMNGCVTEIKLSYKNLKGTVPNFNLPNLIRLELNQNQLTDTVPNFSLPKLTFLELSNNQLTGTIPNFNLLSLIRLGLSFNQLTGSVPKFNLPSLQYLDLYSNQLSGNIPDFNLPNLTYLGLNNNLLNDTIPKFNLPNLKELNLSGNKLTGTIPNFNFPKLESLYLGNNQLIDTIPNFNFPMLTDLFLYQNQLSGTIPNFNFPKLTRLGLYDNQLSGAIPNFSFPNLTDLILGQNQLSGTIPNFSFPNLTDLKLNQNQLTSTIPNFNLPKLAYLQLDRNQLTGSIPNFDLPKLTSLYLYDNQLSGTIPNFNLPKLEYLFLYDNQLSGTIPNFSVPNLKILFLNANKLSGCFPTYLNIFCNISDFSSNPQLPWQGDFQHFCNGEAQIGAPCNDGFATTENDKIDTNCNCKGTVNKNGCAYQDSLQLITLYTATNGQNWTNKWDLSKPMSSWYGILLNAQGCVEYIDLDGGSKVGLTNDFPHIGNSLNGTLPNLNLPALIVLSLNSNKNLGGTIPLFEKSTKLDQYGIGNCSFIGNIPVFTQSTLRYVAICCNQLTGGIPNQIAINCPNLVGFYAQNNKLDGTLPSDFGSLKNLINFYTEGNNISGCFPSTYSAFCSKDTTLFKFENNPKLAYKGIFSSFCKNQNQVGATCDDGDPKTTNDKIDVNCLCKGTLQIDTTTCRYKDSLQLWNWFAANNIPNSPTWKVNWAANIPLNNWTGIDLNVNGCIRCLDLDGNAALCGSWGDRKGVGITSPFPTAVCKLSNLEYLSLRGNQMKSKIPDSIQYLKKLKYFYADSCNLEGLIPDAFWTLSNLEEITLGDNNLNSVLSPKIGNLKKLQSFLISNSNMYGAIPKEIGDCSALINFHIGDNKFSGIVPQEIIKLKLQILNLYNNKIDSIPDISKGDFKNQGFMQWGNGLVYFKNNQLTFNDILPNMVFAQKGNGFDFAYFPQDSCGKYQSFSYKKGDNLTIDVGIDYGITSNTYQWYKGNSTLTSQTNRQLKINNLQLTDVGDYYCEIKNPNALGLTLHRRLIKVNIIDTSSCRYKDSLALVDFYKATNGANWTVKWDTLKPINTWYGVKLNKNGCVNYLNLYDNKLSGSIPLAIYKMSSLDTLSLGSNQALQSWSISNQIGNLVLLKELNLWNSNITGSIPSQIGNLINLKVLVLGSNKISGGIPNKIGNLKKLELLYLNDNLLIDTIPLEIGDSLSLLRIIALNQNMLTGTIPTNLGKLTKLTSLNVFTNKLKGAVPSELSQLSNLEFLTLSYNKFNSIPASFNNFKKLKQLHLQDNLFTTLPDLSKVMPTIAKDTVINGIDYYLGFRIFKNELTFKDILPYIPILNYPLFPNDISRYSPQDSCGTYQSLTFTEGQSLLVDVGVDYGITSNTYQWYKGNSTLTSQTNRQLKINNLQLSDAGNYYCEIKNTIAKDLTLNRRLIKVNIIDTASCRYKDSLQLWNWFAVNNSNPSVPIWKVNWAKDIKLENWDGIKTNGNGCVLEIILNAKNISGNLPNFNLQNLKNLHLSINKLNGSIPPFNNLKDLQYLYLDGNKLNGSIPNFNLTNLENIELEYNQLNSNIPNFSLPNLIGLNLYFNNLSDTIPNFNLPKAKYINLSNNQLSGRAPNFNLPNLEYLSLSSNKLSGNIPNFTLPKIQDIYLHLNQFTGNIPNFKFPSLQLLSLYNNQLTGSIPNFNLPNLKILSLNNNQLSGSVPNLNLPNLRELYLFSNKLSGNILNFNLPNLERISLANNQLSGCFSDSLKKICNIVYNFTNNPLLPFKGDFERFCNGEVQIGAPCDDGNTVTINDKIILNCECKGTNPVLPKDSIPDSSCIENSINKFPDLLTPNDDGYNDIFNSGKILKEHGCSDIDLEGVDLSIINRWGQRVFVGSVLNGWDGQDANGNPLPTGAYWFSIVYGKKGKKPISGVINLIY